MIGTHRVVGLGLLLVAHGDDGQHQVDQVERAEKDDDRKKYHMDWPARGYDLEMKQRDLRHFVLRSTPVFSVKRGKHSDIFDERTDNNRVLPGQCCVCSR